VTGQTVNGGSKDTKEPTGRESFGKTRGCILRNWQVGNQ